MRLVLLGVALGAALTACSADDAVPSEPVRDRLHVDATPERTFTPAALTVHPGDTVAFAFGCLPHIVFFGAHAGAPADIAGQNVNTTIKRVFNIPGTYTYECHVHPGMTGSVTVTGPLTATFVLRNIEGSTPSGRVERFEDGERSVDIFAVTDTVMLDADGNYRQTAWLESRIGSALIGRLRWFDHGHFVVSGSEVHGVSDRLEFITLDGTLDGDGVLRINQDLVRNGRSAVYALVAIP